jgi:hypothetical protein
MLKSEDKKYLLKIADIESKKFNLNQDSPISDFYPYIAFAMVENTYRSGI